MRRVARQVVARGRRSVAGVSPTIFLNPKTQSFVPSTTTRTEVYGLLRFAKKQLQTADASQKASIQADIERYQQYLDEDLAPLTGNAKESVSKGLKLLPSLDRYSQVKWEKFDEYTTTLQKRLDRALEVLSKFPLPPDDIDPDYFNTSKFRILEVHTGTVATIPKGQIPPGAVELLPGQVIRTKVNGENVVIEIEDFSEESQVLWFKPEIPLPSEAEVLWQYPLEPAASEPTGATWYVEEEGSGTRQLQPLAPTDSDIATIEKLPELQQVVNPFRPLLEKIQKLQDPQLKEAFNSALLHPEKHLKLESEYSANYDREVVESKRLRYSRALISAQQKGSPTESLDLLNLLTESTILKGQLIDKLRRIESYIADEQLEARLHERKLLGEAISDLEELDYFPHVRDDDELAKDFSDPTIGRYLWKLFPYLEGDELSLHKDVHHHVIQPVDPLSEVLEKEWRSTPAHIKLEKKILDKVRANFVTNELRSQIA